MKQYRGANLKIGSVKLAQAGKPIPQNCTYILILLRPDNSKVKCRIRKIIYIFSVDIQKL